MNLVLRVISFFVTIILGTLTLFWVLFSVVNKFNSVLAFYLGVAATFFLIGILFSVLAGLKDTLSTGEAIIGSSLCAIFVLGFWNLAMASILGVLQATLDSFMGKAGILEIGSQYMVVMNSWWYLWILGIACSAMGGWLISRL